MPGGGTTVLTNDREPPTLGPPMGALVPRLGTIPRSWPRWRPYFRDDKELQWANLTMRNPLPQPLRAALTYIPSSTTLLHEPRSLGQNQARHQLHATMGPSHRPEMEIDPRGGLDNHTEHPLPSDPRLGHTPTIQNKCINRQTTHSQWGTTGTTKPK